MEKSISRKDFLTDSSKYAIGAVVGVAGLDVLAGGKIMAGTKDVTWPFPYQKLDADTVRDRAHYLYYNGMACCGGVFGAILDALKETVGEPFTNVPTEMMLYGGGGGAGWGVLCGTLNGAAAIINLCCDKTTANSLVNELWGWYCQAELPTTEANEFATSGKYTEKKYNDTLPQNIAGSPLCHVSVTEWCIIADKKVSDTERKERCARIAGDVAAKAVEYLNAVADGTFASTYVSNSDVQACSACHGSAVFNNVMTQMACKSCHGDPHSTTGSIRNLKQVPNNFKLEQNYPNPFNPSTKIQFAIPQIEKVSIKVYDIQGKLIKNIVNHELMNPGSYQVKWDGTDLVGAKVASGIYFARMQAGSFMQTKKMMMLK